MNTIGTVKFDFTLQNEDFARYLYAVWEQVVSKTFENTADSLLTGYDDAEKVIEIALLELDLGQIDEDVFHEKFPAVLKEKFEEALLKCLYAPQPGAKTGKKKNSVYLFDALADFLLHGSLCWDVPAKYRDVNKLFLNVLAEEGPKLKHFLITYGHYASLQQRLVYQLNDTQLEEGIKLLTPGTSGFILSYIHLLKAKYTGIQQPAITESGYRNSVWLVIYSYLLTSAGSYFNKKNFVMRTITSLANKYNLSYSKLLSLIVYEIKDFSAPQPLPTELFKILYQLKNELDDIQLKNSFINAARFYKIVSQSLKKEELKEIPHDTNKALIQVLADADSCRLFLQQLTEKETASLVLLVIPQNSDEVLKTANVLQQQKDEGVLQGKAGGEFRLIKWQIIFAVLFGGKSTSFNFIYFVENVLKRICAHYNIEVTLLLDYFLENEDRFEWAGKQLRQVFSRLRSKNNKVTPESLGQKSKDADFSFPTEYLYDEEKKPDATELFRYLSNRILRNRLIESVSESQCYKMLAILLPPEADFICSYARNLDLRYNNGMLEGKSGSGFPKLKWRFVFSVLTEKPLNNFNRKYFVASTLKEIAAHYNLAYFELLAYFRHEDSAIHLPLQLQVVQNDLFKEEKEKWLTTAVISGNEDDKVKIIGVFRVKEKAFIKSYALLLNGYNSKGFLQGKSSGNFHEIKWRIIFDVLLESQNKAFNKKQFIMQSLSKMAAHYNLTVRDLLGYMHNYGKSAPVAESRFKDVFSIINGLYEQYAQAPKEKPRATPTDKKYKALLLPKSTDNKETGLYNELVENRDFLEYIADSLALLPKLRKYFATELKVTIDNRKMLAFLLQLLPVYKSLSRVAILTRILEYLTASMNDAQRQKINGMLVKWETKNPVLSAVNNNLNTQKMENHIQNNQLTDEPVFINNAGVILLAPYFPRFFTMMEFVENNQFKSNETRIKAIFALQYLVFQKTEFPEHELMLNRILTGFDKNAPLPGKVELTEREIQNCNTLLESAKSNWPKLKSSSVQALVQAFLQRTGKLEEKDGFYYLTIEQKAYDILLDSLPWSFKMTKYSWMDKPLQVNWR